MRKLLSSIFILSIYLPLSSYGQGIVFKDARGATPLTWEDFTGKPNYTIPYGAQTHATVDWEMEAKPLKHDTVFCTFTITLALGDQSWVKPDSKTPLLLSHEQGHYKVSRLWAAELQQKFAETTFFRKDYRNVMFKISNEVMNKYQQMQLQYDKETDHGRREDEQERWADIIQKQLAAYHLQ